jgi:hypothetical protein
LGRPHPVANGRRSLSNKKMHVAHLRSATRPMPIELCIKRGFLHAYRRYGWRADVPHPRARRLAVAKTDPGVIADQCDDRCEIWTWCAPRKRTFVAVV